MARYLDSVINAPRGATLDEVIARVEVASSVDFVAPTLRAYAHSEALKFEEPRAVTDAQIVSIIAAAETPEQAALDVIAFIELAHNNEVYESALDFQPLLAAGHPRAATRGLSAADKRELVAEWHAADASLSETAKKVVFEFFSANPGADKAYAAIKLSAVLASADLEPLTAAWNMSFAKRSAMSRALAAIRRRDRKGRFAEEFGRLKGIFSRKDGSVFTETGKIVGAVDGENAFQVEYPGSADIPKGIYNVPADSTEAVEAYLPERLTKGLKGSPQVSADQKKAATPLDAVLATKADAPEGWSPLKNEQGKVTGYTSPDGNHIVSFGKPDASAADKYADTPQFGVGEGEQLDPEAPIHTLKDKNGNVVAVAQDWATIQKANIYSNLEGGDAKSSKGLSDTDFKSLDSFMDNLQGDDTWTSSDGRVKVDIGADADGYSAVVYVDGKDIGDLPRNAKSDAIDDAITKHFEGGDSNKLDLGEQYGLDKAGAQDTYLAQGMGGDKYEVAKDGKTGEWVVETTYDDGNKDEQRFKTDEEAFKYVAGEAGLDPELDSKVDTPEAKPTANNDGIEYGKYTADVVADGYQFSKDREGQWRYDSGEATYTVTRSRDGSYYLTETTGNEGSGINTKETDIASFNNPEDAFEYGSYLAGTTWDQSWVDEITKSEAKDTSKADLAEKYNFDETTNGFSRTSGEGGSYEVYEGKDGKGILETKYSDGNQDTQEFDSVEAALKHVSEYEGDAPSADKSEDKAADFTPDQLADGYAFSKNSDGSYESFGTTSDGSTIKVSQANDGEWVVTELGGNGPDNWTEKDLQTFKDANSAFDFANNELANPNEFDAEAAKAAVDSKGLSDTDFKSLDSFMDNLQGDDTWTSSDGKVEVVINADGEDGSSWYTASATVNGEDVDVPGKNPSSDDINDAITKHLASGESTPDTSVGKNLVKLNTDEDGIELYDMFYVDNAIDDHKEQYFATRIYDVESELNYQFNNTTDDIATYGDYMSGGAQGVVRKDEDGNWQVDIRFPEGDDIQRTFEEQDEAVTFAAEEIAIFNTNNIPTALSDINGFSKLDQEYKALETPDQALTFAGRLDEIANALEETRGPDEQIKSLRGMAELIRDNYGSGDDSQETVFYRMMAENAPLSSSISPDTNPDNVDAPTVDGTDNTDGKKEVTSSQAAVEKVMAQMLEAIKGGEVPWRKPFTDDPSLAGASLPRNPASKRVYTGTNSMVLGWVAGQKGYTDGRWMTYKQAQDMGGQVRKGEKGTFILVPRVVKYDKNKDGSPILDANGNPGYKQFVTFTSATVFNVAQIDGLDLKDDTKNTDLQAKTPLEAQDFVISRYVKSMEALGLKVPAIHYTYVGKYGSHSSSPNWSPMMDVITLPTLEQFNSPEEIFDTLMHELAHSTGHASRLDRSDLTKDYGNPDGVARAKEELIAEISSAILGQMFGIENTLDNSAAYVQSWMQRLQNNPQEVIFATKEAQKVVDYMLGIHLGDWSPVDGYSISKGSVNNG